MDINAYQMAQVLYGHHWQEYQHDKKRIHLPPALKITPIYEQSFPYFIDNDRVTAQDYTADQLDQLSVFGYGDCQRLLSAAIKAKFKPRAIIELGIHGYTADEVLAFINLFIPEDKS